MIQSIYSFQLQVTGTTRIIKIPDRGVIIGLLLFMHLILLKLMAFHSDQQPKARATSTVTVDDPSVQ